MSIEVAKNTYSYSLKYVLAIVEDFEDKDADFKPEEGALTVVQQIRHTAHTVEWFWQGAFGSGFNMDFEGIEKEIMQPSTLKEAIAYLKKVYERCLSALDDMKNEDLSALLPPNEIMGELPKMSIVSATADHTAHHRGSLAVYLRMTGKTPKMIYMD